jgi:His/Glu/Gln/Arg/opine family amino acid ABC transporter permease subunit
VIDLNYEFSFAWLEKYWPFYVEGLINTLLLAAITVAIGTLLGALLALMRLSNNKLVKFIATAYIEFIRGTPLMVQVFLVHYGISMVMGINLPIFFSGVASLSINSAAYVAEIVRAGIQAVDAGQMEAARSLGMTKGLAMRKIIMPQAVKNILPALGNEFVIIIKESSIVSVIGMGELMYKANTIMGNSFRVFEPLIVVSLVYFALTFSLSKLLGRIEKRMGDGAADAGLGKGKKSNSKRIFGLGAQRDSQEAAQ